MPWKVGWKGQADADSSILLWAFISQSGTVRNAYFEVKRVTIRGIARGYTASVTDADLLRLRDVLKELNIVEFVKWRIGKGVK